MAIPAKKLHQYLQDAKKGREQKHAPPSDGDDDDDDGDDDHDQKHAGPPPKKKPDMPAMVAAAAKKVDDGEVDEDFQELLDEYEPDEDETPPSWVDEADEPLWEQAKGAVKQQWDNYDEPWCVVGMTYVALGGKFPGSGGHEEPDGDEGHGDGGDDDGDE